MLMLSSKPSPTRRRGGTPSRRLLSQKALLRGVQVDPFEGTPAAAGDRPPSSPGPGPVAEAVTSGKLINPARTVDLMDRGGRLGDPHGLTGHSVIAEGAVDNDDLGGIPLVKGLVGGRLSQFYHNWTLVTQDQWVLSTVSQGLTLAFTTEPPSGPHFRETPVPEDPALRQVLEQELHDLLLKRAVIRCGDRYVPKFSAVFFMTPKKGGKWRPILNLRPLNKFIVPRKFRMETLPNILNFLGPGMWVASIDLKDAYLHIPVRPMDQAFLCFSYQQQLFRFVAMPFGLSTAPRIFTRVTKTLAAFLRRKGIRIFMYIDDWLVVADSKARCHTDTLSVIHEAQSPRLDHKSGKVQLHPHTNTSLSGSSVRPACRVGVPNEGETGDPYSYGLRSLPPAVGSGTGMAGPSGVHGQYMVDLIPYCRLRMRPIQWHLLSFFRPSSHLYQTPVPITEVIRPQLLWWSREQNLSVGVRFPRPAPDVTLTTDASLTGWGAYIGEATASGHWQAPWNTFHINRLELEAVSRALIHFSNLVVGQRVLIRTDNTTVVAYINKQGGTHSFPLWRQSWLLFQWAIREGVSLQATHLPGILNVRADILSRQGQVQTTFEWQLNPLVFQQILTRCQVYPEVDLFASPTNSQLPLFCSLHPHESVWRVNALSFTWGGHDFYAFPSPALIPRVLMKVTADSPLSFTLIAPFWPSRPWFPSLIRLLGDVHSDFLCH